MGNKRKATFLDSEEQGHLDSEFKKIKQLCKKPEKVSESKYFEKNGFFCATTPKCSSRLIEGKILSDATSATTTPDETQRPVLKQHVSYLPRETALSKYIELHVNALAPPGTRHVHVRIMSNMSKVFTLKPTLRDFLEQYGIPSELPYMSRVLMCFQETDNGLVAFFAVYVQEYGEKCPLPNKNSAYISMLDSVHLYEPRKLRRSVFYTVLICYLNYLSVSGFSSLYLWCCPPSAGVEYIFHCRPKSQRNPTIDTLRDWYKCLMEMAKEMGILDNFANLVDWCPKTSDEFFRFFPYFFEDHWPDELERTIQSFEDEISASKKLEGKKLTKGRKNSKKSIKKQLDLSDKNEYVYKKIALALRQHKDNFFCMKLNSTTLSAGFKMMTDSENPSVFTDSRDYVVTFFAENNLEFENIDKAVSSTAAFLTEVHEECFYVFCDVCTSCVIDGFSCQTCPFDICKSCVMRNFNHEHKLGKRIKCRDVGDPKVFFRDYDKLSDETIAWKLAKNGWWEDWKNAIQTTTGDSKSALKVLCHLNACKRKDCPACMQFTNLCYFAIRDLKLTPAKMPAHYEKKSKVIKKAPASPTLLKSTAKVNKPASLAKSNGQGNGGASWKQFGGSPSIIKKIYGNTLKTERTF